MTIPERRLPIGVRALPLVMAVAVVGLLSLAPQPDDPSQGPVLFAGPAPVAGAVLNFWFYVPVGLALALLPIRTGVAVLAGASLTLFMEASQLFVPGRVSSALDLVTNTSGTLAGYAAARSWRRLVAPTAARRPAMALAGAALFAGTLMVTGYLMAIEYPAGAYLVQWRPDRGTYDQRYGAAVRSARIGGTVLSRELIEDTGPLRAALLEGTPIQLVAVAAEPSRRSRRLFRMVEPERMPFLVIALDGADVAVTLSRRGREWALSEPTVHAYGILAGLEPGREFSLYLWEEEGRTCVSLDDVVDCGLSPTVGHGWSLLLDPVGNWRTGALLLSFGWLAALAFPVGLWLPAGRGGLPALAMMFAGLVGVPVLTDLPHTSTLEWLAVSTGLALGLSGRGLALRLGEAEPDGAERAE